MEAYASRGEGRLLGPTHESIGTATFRSQQCRLLPWSGSQAGLELKPLYASMGLVPVVANADIHDQGNFELGNALHQAADFISHVA